MFSMEGTLSVLVGAPGAYRTSLRHIWCHGSIFIVDLVCRRGRVTVRSSTSTAVDLVHLYGSGEHVDAILGSYLMILDASSSSAAESAVDNGWLTPLVEGLETVLRYIQTGFDRYHVPYSYGWSIVTLTLFVKTLTFPLTKTQVESTMSMQALKPEIDAIKDKYGDDKDAVQRETAALYEKANVNPLAGCLPTLATIPIFIGLYRSLTSVASQGDLDNQGFYWIPSLAGPTSVAAQKAGSGTAWLFPFVDGHPPVGWELASAYLVLPVALVVAQYISSAIISPPIDPNAENAKVQKALYLCVCHVCLLLLLLSYHNFFVLQGIATHDWMVFAESSLWSVFVLFFEYSLHISTANFPQKAGWGHVGRV